MCGPTQQREGGWNGHISAEAEAGPPALNPRKRAAYLSPSGWAGLADAPRAWVLLPRRNSETPLEILALLGLGGRGALALGFWGLRGAGRGLRGGQRLVRAWQAAPPLRVLGETTASGGCGMRDAGAAANGGAGRRAGAMATANGGQGRGQAAAAGRLASSGVQGLRVRAWWWGR